MKKFTLKIIFGVLLTLTIAVSAFYWNEARKEVVFLCSNFKKGVPEESVLKQLETGNFLRFYTEDLSGRKRLIVESPYNLYLSRCIIDFDSSGVVQKSIVK